MKNIDLNDRDLRRVKDLEEDINLLIISKYSYQTFEQYLDSRIDNKLQILLKEKPIFENSKLIKPKKYLSRPEIAKLIGVENNTIKSWENKNWFVNIGHLNKPKYNFNETLTGIINNCKSSYIITIKEYLQKFENVENLIELCEKR